MRHTGGMDDLLITPGPGAPRGLRIPESELVERFRANVTELSAAGVEVLVEEEAFRPGPRENR